MKSVTDRPGRYFALLVFAPFLVYAGFTILNDYETIGILLIILGFLLFLYELFWVSCRSTDKGMLL